MKSLTELYKERDTYKLQMLSYSDALEMTDEPQVQEDLCAAIESCGDLIRRLDMQIAVTQAAYDAGAIYSA